MRSKTLLVMLVVVGFLLTSLGIVQPAQAQSDTVNVVALGDSYTAGNGAEDYYGPSGCFRSHNNYSKQYVNLLKQRAQVTYTNLSCSGAVTGSIPGQVAENQTAVSRADLILMSIGGNDLQFSDVVLECFVLASAGCAQHVDSVGEQELVAVVNKIESVVSLVRSRAPHARIVVVGYPYLLGDCNKEISLSNTQQPYPIGRKLQSLQARFNQLLTAKMSNLRYVSGWDVRYVELQGLYRGHEYCGGKELWLVQPLKSWPYMEYFHPNFAGHNATALHLYFNNIHNGMLGGDQSEEQHQGQTTGGQYVNLPFACGFTIPHVSTYDTFGSFSHGHALDMPVRSGTAVVSPVAGKVTVLYDPPGYGRYVDVLDPSGITHRFAHLQMSVSVVSGQTVQRGDQIGKVGTTGATTGPHLHYEWRLNGQKILINLGAVLNWGAAQDAGGYRTTTHTLKSGNCGGSHDAPTKQDLLIWERTTLRYARSNGRTYSNWEPFVSGISNPTRTDACEFDGDRYTEYLSYEGNFSHFALGNPTKSGFGWSIVSANHPNVDSFVCVDWNQDGKEDIWMRNTFGNIYLGISGGEKVAEWRVLVNGIGPLSHLDSCDINGDGQDEVVAYEPGFTQLMVAVRESNKTMQWRRLASTIGPISGLACGDFISQHRGDEVIVWQPEQNGRYVMGEFDSSFGLVSWEPLSPTGLGAPFKDEIVAGDIDADGLDELIVNEYRVARGSHSIMVGNFTSARRFEWYPFIEGITAQNMEVGDFID